ncbi:hypothetical protein [Geoglobus sp.]
MSPSILLSVFFGILAMFQAKASLPDALVLVAISATYFRGWILSKDAYFYVATLLAISLSLLKFLTAVSAYIDAFLLGEVPRFELDPAVYGILVIPFAAWNAHKKKN